MYFPMYDSSSALHSCIPDFHLALKRCSGFCPASSQLHGVRETCFSRTLDGAVGPLSGPRPWAFSPPWWSLGSHLRVPLFSERYSMSSLFMQPRSSFSTGPEVRENLHLSLLPTRGMGSPNMEEAVGSRREALVLGQRVTILQRPFLPPKCPKHANPSF